MLAPARFLVRDAALAVVAGGLWLWLGTRGGADAPIGLHILTGLVSVLAAATLHEWGHLVGARATDSVVHFPAGVFNKLLFDFDVEHNDRRQFLAMSVGGYVGSFVGAALLFVVLPRGLLATTVAWIGIALGVGVSVAIELPTTIRVLRGAAPPPPLVTVSRRPDGVPKDARRADR